MATFSPIAPPMILEEILATQDFSGVEPLEAVTDLHVIKAAIFLKTAITIKTTYTGKSITEVPPEKIGPIALKLTAIIEACKKFGISQSIQIMEAVPGIEFSPEFRLPEFINRDDYKCLKPFFEDVLPQCDATLLFSAIVLVLSGKEITKANLRDEAFELQIFGLPPLRNSKAKIMKKLSYSMPSSPAQSPYPYLSSVLRNVVSPYLSTSFTNTGGEAAIAENDDFEADGSEADGSKADGSKADGFKVQGRQRQLFGVGSRPLSEPLNTDYNREKEDDMGICQSFEEFYQIGITKGYNDRLIFKKFTDRVQKVHAIHKGKPTSDIGLRSFVKFKLGKHFNDWVGQYPA